MINDIALLIPFILFLWGIKIKIGGGYREDYLSLHSCLSIRGFLAILIVFHHIGLKAETSSLFYQLGHIGHLCTAVFFFLSGYGVMTRYMHDSSYQFGFLRNRLVSVLIPWLLVTVLYYLFDIVNGEAQTMGEIINDLLKGRLIANNSWYVIVVSLCYICFYFAIMISDGKRKGIIVVTIFGAIIWLGICCLCHLGSYYYETSHVFALGVLYAAIEKETLKK